MAARAAAEHPNQPALALGIAVARGWLHGCMAAQRRYGGGYLKGGYAAWVAPGLPSFNIVMVTSTAYS